MSFLVLRLIASLILIPSPVNAFTPNLQWGSGINRKIFQLPNGHGQRNRGCELHMVDLIEETQERSYIMIKPDGVQRGLVGEVITRFEKKGFKLVAMKTMIPTDDIIKQHYKDLVEKPFFPEIEELMTSGPVVGMVWEGRDVVKTGRKMLGSTDPIDAAPGTIRGDYGIEVGRNIIHGSDSLESAETEIRIWFDKSELLEWKSHSFDQIYRLS